MYPFRRLSVWEKSHELVLRVYRATDGLPARRSPGLVAQLRRAAASIPANIAEGSGHDSQAQFNRYLTIAVGSAHETDYHLLLARDLGVIAEREYAHLEARLGQVQGMLLSLRKRVAERARGGRKTQPRRSEAGK